VSSSSRCLFVGSTRKTIFEHFSTFFRTFFDLFSNNFSTHFAKHSLRTLFLAISSPSFSIQFCPPFPKNYFAIFFNFPLRLNFELEQTLSPYNISLL
jgi:hypothetical protein